MGDEKIGSSASTDLSEGRFQAIFDQSPFSAQIFSSDGTTLRVNRAWKELWGVHEQDVQSVVIGHYNVLADPILEAKGIAPLIRRAFKGEAVTIPPVEYDPKETGRPGRIRWVRAHFYPIHDKNGELHEVLLIHNDISEEMVAKEQLLESDRRQKQTLEALKSAVSQQKESLDELARSNKDLQQFAYVASHDLKEPLRMVSTYVQMLEHKYKDRLPGEASEYIAFAVAGVKRMQAMINDLLAYAQVGQVKDPFTPVDCNLIVEEVLKTLAAKIKDSQAQVTCSGFPTVLGNPIQLVQLFQNLIGNAIKFRREDPLMISLSAKDMGSAWEFCVADNGIGIAPTQLDRIFVIFQRLHRRELYPGTGIGLAICKRIVERHGGELWARSEEGKGTQFFFTLPKPTLST